MHPKSKLHHDVLIVGGGLAGLSLALLLARAGVDTAVIERTPFATQTKRSFDIRTTALAAGTIRVLNAAGVWSHLEKQACAIEEIEILDGPRLAETWPVLLNFRADMVDAKAFGYIVDNLDLRIALAQEAERQKHLTLYAPTDITMIDNHADHVAVTLDDGRMITTNLLVGADGRGSAVRDHYRIRTRGWPYDHTAVVATITHAGAHNNIAIEHFLSDGPFAVLPVSNDDQGQHRSAIVWSARPHQARAIMRMSDDAFMLALSARLPERYGEILDPGKRAAWPITLQHAQDYIAPRMALVADAAHGIHPIAGQGLNLGMRDIADLADLIITQGGDVGRGDILQAYQTRRRADTTLMVGATDILTGLFGLNGFGIPVLRKAGLRIVQAVPTFKKFFIGQAMGGNLTTQNYAWDQPKTKTKRAA